MNGYKGVIYWMISCIYIIFAGCRQQIDRQTGKPNIFIAISDDQSWEHASAYGYEAIKTPAFDRIAAEGLLFNNAFSAAPGCSPSRAALLTGRQMWQLEEAGSHACSFPSKYIVFTDLLEEAGYFVGYTGKGWGPGRWDISGRDRNPAGKEYNDLDQETPEHIRNTDHVGNFEKFLESRDPGKPFCFWFGGSEPHRPYDRGIGARNGMDPSKVKVPPFLPDNHETRLDMLDYLYEIQWFDMQLGKMIDILEKRGELDQTIIFVTSDNGMPYPRAKANMYEYSFHMPLAICWRDGIKGGRIINDLVSLIDIAPTILEVTGIEFNGEYGMEGKSLADLFFSNKEGWIDDSRTAVFTGRERHSSSRWNNLSYPIRAMRTSEYLYIRNFKPERWPAGAPQRLEPEDISWEGDAGGYHDIDDYGLSYIFRHKEDPDIRIFHELATGKRPSEELYNIIDDPGCIINLVNDPGNVGLLKNLRIQFEAYLLKTGDPRMTGNGDIYETYPRYSPIRKFTVPDWMDNGK